MSPSKVYTLHFWPKLAHAGEGQPERETLAHFAVVLAARRGQLAALDGKVKHLVEPVEALAEGCPKGPPMIAWHELDGGQAAAVRADLAQWAEIGRAAW